MMRPLWLDFQRSEPGPRRIGTGLLLAGLVCASLLTVDYLALSGQLEAREFQVSRLQRQADMSREMQESRAEGAAPSRWDQLFGALEGASSEQVTLLALKPGSGTLQISGEAKDMGAALDYLGRLQQVPSLRQTWLTHSEIDQESPLHPLRFTLATQWKEPGQDGGLMAGQGGLP